MPARFQDRELIVFLVPRFDPVPTQTVIECEVGPQPPTVLRVKAEIFVASVKGLELALVVLGGSAEQEVGEIGSGLAAEKKEAAVELSNGMSVDLVVVKFAADLNGMSARDFGKVVEPLVSVVGLLQFIRVGSDGVVIEDDVLHALRLRRERHDAWSIGSDLETLRCQADTESALRTAQIVGIAQVTEAEFVDRSPTQRPGVAQVQQLGAAQI